MHPKCKNCFRNTVKRRRQRKTCFQHCLNIRILYTEPSKCGKFSLLQSKPLNINGTSSKNKRKQGPDCDKLFYLHFLVIFMLLVKRRQRRRWHDFFFFWGDSRSWDENLQKGDLAVGRWESQLQRCWGPQPCWGNENLACFKKTEPVCHVILTSGVTKGKVQY